MDGSDRRILVSDGLKLPNGLTFDFYRREICWADAGMSHDALPADCVPEGYMYLPYLPYLLAITWNYAYSVARYTYHTANCTLVTASQGGNSHYCKTELFLHS